MNNPFDITKAVDFTDDEIVKYWVDINNGSGFEDMLKPTSLMPIILKGSKGSGKTHIMRFFSYELQKIKYKSNLSQGLEKDKFIGVYIRCSGFNSDRFKGKGNTDEKWKTIYTYYWELWVAQIVLNCVIDLMHTDIIVNIDEQEIVDEILLLLNRDIFQHPHTLIQLKDFFAQLQREVDYETENCVFRRDKQINIEVLISPTKITYGLPKILKDRLRFFANKHVLYLIDELENFSENQQELVQTLLREKPTACTFRIGSRLHGVKTYKTLGSGEENREGSEFDEIILDEFLRESSDKYSEFVKSICNNRLNMNGYYLDGNKSIECFIEELNIEKLLAKIVSKKELQSKSYINRLKSKLKTYKVLKDTDIEKIANNLKFEKDVIIERTNVFLFYREWNKNSSNLFNTSSLIHKEADLYYGNKDMKSSHGKVLAKYKNDIIDILSRETREDIPYYGFETLVKMSCGTPRNLLNLLKYAFAWVYFNSGITPFKNGVMLTNESQTKGIKDTISWFFEENRIPSHDGRKIVDCVERIGNLLREMRFSDTPSQCSINIFGLKLEELSSDARETLKTLLNYSYIIQVNDRRDKNTNEKLNVYHINFTISPRWELPISKRGLVSLSKSEAECIFNINMQDDYEKTVALKLKKYNAPFGITVNNAPTLPFD